MSCFFSNMMDEQLIDEVAQHAVIFNRQKYYLNGSSNGNGSMADNKYETKCEAWQSISMKLRSDVETCKKRWKYLRERYVSQRKQGDPPVYEHLSRPYLEKMKFLDSHIQPRKSYRNVPNFLTSPHSANSSNFNDYNMDSKSNSSMKSMGNFGQHGHHFADQQHAMNALSSAAAAASALEGDSRVKLEADQVFRDFAAAVASQHLQQISQTQMHHQQSAAVAAAMVADSPQNYTDHFRDAAGSVVAGAQNNGIAAGGGNSGAGLHSSSSSIKSPLSSPLGATNHNGGSTSAGHSTATLQLAAAHTSSSSNATGNGGTGGVTGNSSHFNQHSFNDSHNDDLDSSTSSNYNMKKPRVQLNSNTPNSSTSQLNHNNTGHTNSHHNSHNNLNANNSHYVDGSDDDDTDDNGSSLLTPLHSSEHQTADNPFQSMNAASTSSAAAAAVALHRSQNYNSNQQSNTNNPNSSQSSPSNMFSSNADFLFQLYQQLPQHHHNSHHQQQHNSNGGSSQQFNKFQVPHTPPPSIQRSSEHLLGELVTTELLKMSKDRRRNVQKRILEILFFDD